jgi:hypothetical protein
MNRMVRCGLVLIALALSTSSGTAKVYSFPVGDWYGEGQPGDPNYHWLAHYGPDGSFAIEFRHCIAGKADDDTEAGTWAYAKGRNRITTEYVEGTAVHDVDDYDTVSFDGSRWKYRMMASLNPDAPIGFVFTAVRVPGSFTLPACDTTS